MDGHRYVTITGEAGTILESNQVTVVSTFRLPWGTYGMHELNEEVQGQGYYVTGEWEAVVNPNGVFLRAMVRERM